MKVPKGVYFLFNILFILAVGYLLAPLPSAQSIAREWVVRIEKQVANDATYDQELQLKSLKKLIKNGSVRFSKKDSARGYFLLSLIQKQFAEDMKSGRIDQIVGVLSDKHLQQMSKLAQDAFQKQGELGGNFYVLTPKAFNKKKLKDKFQCISLHQGDVPFEAYYLVTSRSGKKFLLTVEENQDLEFGFLLMTHKDSKAKWKKARQLLPASISDRKLMSAK